MYCEDTFFGRRGEAGGGKGGGEGAVLVSSENLGQWNCYQPVCDDTPLTNDYLRGCNHYINIA